jgi:hypothetical protein
MTEIFIAWIGQPIDHNTDNVEYVRRVHQRVEAGNNALSSWIALHRGSTISQSGPEGKAVLPNDALDELPKIKEQYEQALGCPVSFGIGDSLSEAVKAVAIAVIKGVGQTVIYSPRQENVFNELQKPNSKETEDILLKSGEQVPHAENTNPGQSHLGKPAAPILDEGVQPPEKTEQKSPEPAKAQEWDPDKQSAGDIANLLNTYAQPSDTEQGPDLSALKQETGVILKQIKELVPNIEELQSQFPELYQGYLLLVQAFIELNKQEPMSKSEKDDEAELMEKALDSFALSEFAPEDEVVKKYSELETEAPPIFMVGDKVVDGKKRLSAAKAKGDKSVKVYMAKAGFVLGSGLSKLPIGSTWQGRTKELDPESGTPRWKMLLSGQIASHNQDPNKSSIPRAVSSTRPND